MNGGGNIVTWEKLEQQLDDMSAKKAFTLAMGRQDNDFEAFKIETMKKTQNADNVDLSRIREVISSEGKYSNAVRAIDELIAE